MVLLVNSDVVLAPMRCRSCLPGAASSLGRDPPTARLVPRGARSDRVRRDLLFGRVRTDDPLFREACDGCAAKSFDVPAVSGCAVDPASCSSRWALSTAGISFLRGRGSACACGRVRDALRAGRTCLSRGWPHDWGAFGQARLLCHAQPLAAGIATAAASSDADDYSRIDCGSEYRVRADVTRRAAAVRPRGGGPRNLAPPARTLWPRHGCVAHAGLGPSARDPRSSARSAVADARRQPRTRARR